MENATAEDYDAAEVLSEADLIKQRIRDSCYQNENPKSYCPETFDGWSCWKATPPGETAYQQCPSFILGFDSKRFAHKDCMEDGTWFRHPVSQIIWSNYTTCVNEEELKVRETLITIQEVGYFISIVALILALIIFNSFRQLQCSRVTIHKHLFVSFIISNVFWLVWYRVFIRNPNMLVDPENEIWCNIVDGLLQYFMMANYFWIFCEGFYLHYIVVFPFSREGFTPLKIFILFGWICSGVPVILYYYFSIMDAEQKNEIECVAMVSNWKIFLYVPTAIVSIINFVFLINILRVLIQSVFFLSQRATFSTTSGILKSAWATLILIPFLGLNFLLSILQPSIGSEDTLIREFIAGVFFPFQGLFVSFLFCILNADVLEALRRDGLCWKKRQQPESIVFH